MVTMLNEIMGIENKNDQREALESMSTDELLVLLKDIENTNASVESLIKQIKDVRLDKYMDASIAHEEEREASFKTIEMLSAAWKAEVDLCDLDWYSIFLNWDGSASSLHDAIRSDIMLYVILKSSTYGELLLPHLLGE